jgi:hypothetical protein
MFSLRISLNQQDPWRMFSSLFSPTSPCFLKHPCSLSLSLSLSLCCCRKCGLWQSEGVSGGVVFCLFPMCFHQVPNVFPVGSPSSQLFLIKFSRCSQKIPQILNCVLIKFSKCSHNVPQVPNVFLMTFPIATFIPYKCSLCCVGPSVNALRAQLNFSFQTQFLKFGFGTKSTQKSISFTP